MTACEINCDRGLCVRLQAFFGRSGDGCFSTASQSIARLDEFDNLSRRGLQGDEFLDYLPKAREML